MNKFSDTIIFASANMIFCNWRIIKVLSMGTQMKVIGDSNESDIFPIAIYYVNNCGKKLSLALLLCLNNKK